MGRCILGYPSNQCLLIATKGHCNLTDQKLKETLLNVYKIKRSGKSFEPDDITSLVIQVYEYLSEDQGHSQDLIGKVLLRIVISINSMTGGTLGNFGYLNFLKNNIRADSPKKDLCVLETQDGKLKTMPKQTSSLKS